MSSLNDSQQEEKEALISIYEGDNLFKLVSDTVYQYKYGEEDSSKSFLLEILWTDDYPNELPKINLETFYNRNLSQSAKTKIIDIITEEGNQWLGCGMTYTLFECLKEKLVEIFENEVESTVKDDEISAQVDKINLISESKTAAPKKEQLTKAQKRRQWEKSDHKGEKPRGYNWVDIVKHLSQTGGKAETS